MEREPDGPTGTAGTADDDGIAGRLHMDTFGPGLAEFFVAAAVVAASDCVALMPRYTTGMHHPDLVLRPISRLGPARHIDCLARPESLERVNVKSVLAQRRAVTAGLAEPTFS